MSFRSMDRLSTDLRNMSLKKRSFVDAFLEEEASENTASKKSTRLELARAKNRRDRANDNMRKLRDRIKVMMARLREHEAEYEASKQDVKRLKEQLGDD